MTTNTAIYESMTPTQKEAWNQIAQLHSRFETLVGGQDAKTMVQTNPQVAATYTEFGAALKRFFAA